MEPGILHARSLARELLLAQKPARLPVKVQRLRLEHSVIIDSLEHYCMLTGDTLERLCAGTGGLLQDGCTLVRRQSGQNIYIILYNEKSRSARRRNFTLAHEIGHIYLGHEQDSPAHERQANAFASELLMPRVLAAQYLSQIGGMDAAGALAQAFDVSLSMARVHLNTPSPAGCSAQEQQLLARYRAALPSPNQPEIAY